MDLTEGLISVIMTNYNTPEDCLREAIESVLNQTYSDFEFIIVDDCSTDDSLSFIRTYQDKRIVILQNNVNMGLTKSLNRALEIAKGEYVARMDSDDICEPERFEKQVAYLKAHREVIVCGTWARLFGAWRENGYSNEILSRTIPDRETHRIMLLFGNYPNVIHSSAMFRHSYIIEKAIRYFEQYIYAQDYRMWVECSKYAPLYIIPEILLNYRVHGNAITAQKRDEQGQCARNIMKEQLSWLGLTLDENNEKYHVNFLSRRQPCDEGCLKWVRTIIAANKTAQVYDQKKLESVLWKKWAEIVYFELRKCNIIEKWKRLNTLPWLYRIELVKIWKLRKRSVTQ